jgi:hypothetical protein
VRPLRLPDMTSGDPGASTSYSAPALAERVARAEIVREERKGEAPSDHGPVLVDISTNWS